MGSGSSTLESQVDDSLRFTSLRDSNKAQLEDKYLLDSTLWGTLISPYLHPSSPLPLKTTCSSLNAALYHRGDIWDFVNDCITQAYDTLLECFKVPYDIISIEKALHAQNDFALQRALKHMHSDFHLRGHFAAHAQRLLALAVEVGYTDCEKSIREYHSPSILDRMFSTVELEWKLVDNISPDSPQAKISDETLLETAFADTMIIPLRLIRAKSRYAAIFQRLQNAYFSDQTLRWSVNDIALAFAWANETQLQWIIEHSEPNRLPKSFQFRIAGKIAKMSPIDAYIFFQRRPQISFLERLFELGSEIGPDTLLQICLLDNNIDALRYLVKRVERVTLVALGSFLKVKLYPLLYRILERTADSGTIELELDSKLSIFVLPEKTRCRTQRLFQAVDFFRSINWPGFEKNGIVITGMGKIQNDSFQELLRRSPGTLNKFTHFLSIPSEIQLTEIPKHFDMAALFSFGVSCKSIYSHFQVPLSKLDIFDAVDECARNGYVQLLKEFGVFDRFSYGIALDNGQKEAADLIGAGIRAKTFDAQRFNKMLTDAMGGANAALMRTIFAGNMSVYNTLSSTLRWKAFISIAEAGRLDLILAHFVDPVTKKLPRESLERAFLAAIEGKGSDNYDLLRYCFDQGAPFPRIINTFGVRNERTLRYLNEKVPHLFQAGSSNIRSFQKNFARWPSIETFEYLEEMGWLNSEVVDMLFLDADLKSDISKRTPQDRKVRFEIMSRLVQSKTSPIRLPMTLLEPLYCWADLHQLTWMLERSDETKQAGKVELPPHFVMVGNAPHFPYPNNPISFFLYYRERGDLESLEYLIDHGALIDNDAVLTAILLKNNVDVLELFYSKFPDLFQAISSALTFRTLFLKVIARVLEGRIDGTEDLVNESGRGVLLQFRCPTAKARIRPQLMFRAVKWFVTKRLPGFEAKNELLGDLLKVEHKGFVNFVNCLKELFR